MKKIITVSILGLMMLLSFGQVAAMDDFDIAYVRAIQEMINNHDGEWCPNCMNRFQEIYDQYNSTEHKKEQEQIMEDDAKYARELYEEDKKVDIEQRTADEKLAQKLYQELNPGNELPSIQNDQDDTVEADQCLVCFEGFDMLTPCCKKLICRLCWEGSLALNSLCPHCRNEAIQ